MIGLSERVRRADRMWRIYSGGRLAGESHVEGDAASLRVRREPTPVEPEYPSLVDASLVWLVLEVAAPLEMIVTLRWQAEGGVQVTMSTTIPAEARSGIESIARAIAFEAGLIEPPRIQSMDVGRGAWEQAGYAAEPRVCGTCPFARASNLDCPECRSVARVAEGLRALDFDPDLSSRVALEVEFLLAQIQGPELSHAFFDEWGLRFADAAREHFEVEDDLEIARDLIEAQMVQPWFRLPPIAEKPKPRPLPPVLADAELGAAARRRLRELVEAGIPRWQAERRVQQSLTLRRLLAAEGELLTQRFGGGVAEIRGSLDRLLLTIGPEGEEPWVVEVATPLGRAIELRRGLDGDERTRLRAEVTETHRQLIDAVTAERRAMAEADDNKAIALALENLRGPAANGRE